MVDTNNNQETLECLGSLKYKELQALAKTRGIKANLSKGKLIQELLSASTQDQADTTRTPADLNLGDDGDSTGDVGGAGDGDKSRDKPQDGSIGDGGDVDRDDDREVANSIDGDRDTNSSSDDTPEDKSQDTPQNEPQGGAQQSQDGFSEPQDDCNEPIGVCDVRQDASFNFEDTAVDAGQNADSTSQPGPTETKQQKEQEQTQKQEERQQEQQQQQEEQVAPGSERRRSERLVVANKEKSSVAVAPRKIQSPKFVTKRPAACPSSRFELAHQNMFALQPSIERYGKTPKKASAQTGVSKGKVPAGRQMVAKAKTPSSKANPPAGTPARPLEAVFGSGLKSVKRGLTVASKPCTLVVQRSNKKPTQVKEFRLSSNPNMREGFTFKPYSGPVRPMTPAGGALADKTSGFNIGSSGISGHGSQNASKKAFLPLEPVWMKAKLANGRAQTARRSAHLQSGKVHREKKIAEGRADRA